MWTLLRNNKLLFITTLVVSLAGSSAMAGPINTITILLSGNSFTAGVTTNTPTTTIFINTFADALAIPDAGEVVTLAILDGGTVVDNAMTPSSFTTTGTGIINGGNASLPLTFFRASSSIQLRATSATRGAVGTSSAFTVVASSATKLVILGPGMTHAPGTNPSNTTGLSGAFTAQEPNQPFTVTVILTDSQFNQVSANDTVSFASGDQVTLPAAANLVGGSKDFSVTMTGARITRTLTITDTTNAGVAQGTLDITTAGPAAKEVFPFPNPFNPRERNITFRFRLSEPKSVGVHVTDIFGQRVWRRDVSAGVGFTDVSWDGRNDAGVVVAAGVYYVMLEIDGSIESEKRFGVVK